MTFLAAKCDIHTVFTIFHLVFSKKNLRRGCPLDRPKGTKGLLSREDLAGEIQDWCTSFQLPGVFSVQMTPFLCVCFFKKSKVLILQGHPVLFNHFLIVGSILFCAASIGNSRQKQ